MGAQREWGRGKGGMKQREAGKLEAQGSKQMRLG